MRPNPIPPSDFKRATRSSGLHPTLESGDVSKYQAGEGEHNNHCHCTQCRFAHRADHQFCGCALAPVKRPSVHVFLERFLITMLFASLVFACYSIYSILKGVIQ